MLTLKSISFISIIFGCLLMDSFVQSLPNMIRGRRFNQYPKKLKLSGIPEQYYDQRLDHFNEANKATWKQVI